MNEEFIRPDPVIREQCGFAAVWVLSARGQDPDGDQQPAAFTLCESMIPAIGSAIGSAWRS